MFKTASAGRPSVFPGVFLELAQFFSETGHCVRDPYGDVRDRAEFVWTNSHRVKMVRDCPQTGKSSHYFYGPLTFCKNCVPAKNLALKLRPKMLSAKMD